MANPSSTMQDITELKTQYKFIVEKLENISSSCITKDAAELSILKVEQRIDEKLKSFDTKLGSIEVSITRLHENFKPIRKTSNKIDSVVWGSIITILNVGLAFLIKK